METFYVATTSVLKVSKTKTLYLFGLLYFSVIYYQLENIPALHPRSDLELYFICILLLYCFIYLHLYYSLTFLRHSKLEY